MKRNTIDDELKRAKSVTSEAGSVEYIDPQDAIELDKYRRKLADEDAGKVGMKRCQWGTVRSCD